MMYLEGVAIIDGTCTKCHKEIDMVCVVRTKKKGYKTHYCCDCWRAIKVQNPKLSRSGGRHR